MKLSYVIIISLALLCPFMYLGMALALIHPWVASLAVLGYVLIVGYLLRVMAWHWRRDFGQFRIEFREMITFQNMRERRAERIEREKKQKEERRAREQAALVKPKTNWSADLMNYDRHRRHRSLSVEDWGLIPPRSATKGTGYRAYLLTPEWKQRRAIKLKQAGYRCQLCNETGGLDVHHRTYDRAGNERIDDLIVLCRSCHDVFHQHRRVG